MKPGLTADIRLCKKCAHSEKHNDDFWCVLNDSLKIIVDNHSLFKVPEACPYRLEHVLKASE